MDVTDDDDDEFEHMPAHTPRHQHHHHYRRRRPIKTRRRVRSYVDQDGHQHHYYYDDTGDSDWIAICFVFWVILIFLALIIPLGFYTSKTPRSRWILSKSCGFTCTADDDDFVEAVCASLSQCNAIADLEDRLDILEAAA